jgi:hypothetical protein
LIPALAYLPAAFAPPTVAETKRNFIEAYTRPIPAIYNTVLQELLVQQHFIRYGINYQYNAVSGCLVRLVWTRQRTSAVPAAQQHQLSTVLQVVLPMWFAFAKQCR